MYLKKFSTLHAEFFWIEKFIAQYDLEAKAKTFQVIGLKIKII